MPRAFISDDAARAEFCGKNPVAAPETRACVKFRSGPLPAAVGGNVVGIGNASGFVEPLEATALVMVITCSVARSPICLARARARADADDAPPLQPLVGGRGTRSATSRAALPASTAARHAVLAHCRAETDLAGAGNIAAFFQEVGPSVLATGTLVPALSPFGIYGYLALLTGQRVPQRNPWIAPTAERTIWQRQIAKFGSEAQAAMTVVNARWDL